MENHQRNKIIKRIIQVIIQYIAIAVLLFLSAGTIKWIWAWIYLFLGLLVLIANAFVLSPDLIAERGQPKKNVKKFDKIITSIIIIPVLAIFIVAGLDIRYSLTNQIGLAIHLLGIFLFIIGNVFFTWAMVSNKYFSTLVRIQHDRDHKMATSGPYKYIRHPGYTGYILFTIAAPLLLGSWWSLIPAIIVSILFIIRTYFEDRTLQKELNGYKDYASRVKYQLLKGIW